MPHYAEVGSSPLRASAQQQQLGLDPGGPSCAKPSAEERGSRPSAQGTGRRGARLSRTPSPWPLAVPGWAAEPGGRARGVGCGHGQDTPGGKQKSCYH